MDKELETYYNNYFDLFRKEGWKQLMEELKNNALFINSVEAVKDEADMYSRKGQLQVLASLLNLETTITNAQEELDDDAKSI